MLELCLRIDARRIPSLSVPLLALSLAAAVACGSRSASTSGTVPPSPSRTALPEASQAVSSVSSGAASSGSSQTNVGGGPAGASTITEPGAREGALAEVSRTEATVRAGPMEDVFLLTGELHAVRSLDLVTPRTEVWRVQIKWMAEDGTDVREGDRVVEFDNSSVAQTIEEKRLGHIQTQIELESRSASLAAEAEEKRFAHERAKTEVEKARVQAAIPEEIQSKRDWQVKQAALRQAEASLEKARLELDSFEVASKAEIENLEIARDKAAREIEAAQRTLEALALRAPKAGIFVISENWNEDRKYQIGDTVWPGQTIATIPELTVMEAVPYLSDVDDGRIGPGMSARVVLDTYPERVFKGKVEEVASIADKKGFRVRVSLEESDPNLMRPGMSIRAEVVRRKWERALTVPKQAVRHREGKTYVAKAGTTDPVEVRLAACTPIDCVIESGLAEGDHVLLR